MKKRRYTKHRKTDEFSGVAFPEETSLGKYLKNGMILYCFVI